MRILAIGQNESKCTLKLSHMLGFDEMKLLAQCHFQDITVEIWRRFAYLPEIVQQNSMNSLIPGKSTKIALVRSHNYLAAGWDKQGAEVAEIF